MKIGLHIGPLDRFPTMARFLEFVRHAEALGFDPLLFSDTVSMSHFHVFDPFVLTGLVAGATRHAALGTCVTTPVTRHPSVLANAFGTLGHAIAPRRAILGIGSGDTAAYLIGKRHVRLRVLREFVQTLRGFLDGEPVEYEGHVLRSNWRRHDTPIFLAADGPRTLALGGEIAQGVILGAGILPEVVRWAEARIAEGERRAGRASGSTELWVDTIVSVGEDREAVRRAVRARVSNRANHNFRIDYHCVPEAHMAEARRFRENYVEGDVGAHSGNVANVTDYLVDRFAIAGTRDDVVQRFESLAALGVGTVLVAMPFHLEQRFQIIELLARDVMPRVDP
ncbi:MAG: LLM class flavin-dependent oxidoreductase [Ectothiorhodospiraceae bacterium]|nr:LLM class flavin-dependent oxidoreductase [Ectothiorhodospiraceae bacterium]